MRVRIRSRMARLITVAAFAPILVAIPAPVQAKPAPKPVTPRTLRTPLLPATHPAIGANVRQGVQAKATGTRAAARGTASGGAASIATSAVRLLGATAAQPVTSDVTVIGLTWDEGTGAKAVVQYRSRTGSTWTPWQVADSDPTRAEATGSGAVKSRAGTDPIVLTAVTAVQARVVGPAGATPAHAALEIIDPGASSYDGVSGTDGALSAGAAAAAAPRPAVNSRAAWGANERLRQTQPSYGAVKGVVIHHTAGTNAYTPAQVPAIMRGIYSFHVTGRKWSDIAYNALVDKWGRIWEGRQGGLGQAVVGAHTLGHNGHTMGISMMGDYGQSKPSTAALDSVARIIAWKSGIHQFAPNGTTNLYGKVRPVVVGHRDVGQTTCPGAHVYAKLPWIRARAAALSGYNPALTLSRDVDHQGGSDVLARNRAGVLQRFSAGTDGRMTGPRAIGPGWAPFDQVMAAGDLDSDRVADVLARHAPTGRLYLYPGTSRGGLGRGRVVGFGWTPFRQLVSPGDVTGDGRPDLIGQHSSGALMLYPGTGRGGFGRSRVIASSLPSYRMLVGVGDWDGDRKPDLIGVTASGTAHLLRGVGPNGIASTVQLSGNFSSYRALAGVSDTDGDGRTEVFGVDGSGTTYLGRSAGTSVSWSPAGPSAAGLTVFSG